MAVQPSTSRKGHPLGGPFRLSTAVALALVLGACGGSSSGPEQPRPEEAAILRPHQVYRQSGLVAGPEHFPVVASFSTIAGPADSTYVVFALSIPNSALRFERDESGFIGRYEVGLDFWKDGAEVQSVQGSEAVRVGNFEETGRTDESVVYQKLVALEPGNYTVEVTARDLNGTRGFTTEEELEVPSYRHAGRYLSRPIFVYQAEARPTTVASPEFIINPRHTIPYGGESPLVYLEGYDVPDDEPVTLRVLGPNNTEVWSQEVSLEPGSAASGSEAFGHAIVEIPAQKLPIGQLWLELRAGADTLAALHDEVVLDDDEPDTDTAGAERVPLLVTISDQWMVANFDEVLEFISYIATRDEINTLREAEGAERMELWDEFWERRNPTPASPINEYRERFFERVRTATVAFQEGSRPGWRTDRGEVYIVLGAPDFVQERYTNRSHTNRPDALEWIYERAPTGRLSLIFISRHGFDRFELTHAARSVFRSAAARLRPTD